MSSLLAFDTATEHMSIALMVDGTLSVHEAAGGAQASATLIPAILRLLADAGTSLAKLDAIGFGRGPGAFTGLRTACSVAQGLAFGAGKPVLCLDTLAAVADDARRLAGGGIGDVWVLMDARMNEIYAARYRFDEPTGWRAVNALSLYALDVLNDSLAEAQPTAVAGSALNAFGEKLRTGAALRVPDALPRAAALARVADDEFRAGRLVNAAEALPLYVRDKVAQTTAERDAAKALKALASAPSPAPYAVPAR